MDPAMQLEVAAMSRQQAIRNASALGDSDVQRFYCGRVVFLTGGSGFLGQALMEKLLRNCRVSKVFMLLRTKKGKDVQDRLQDLMKDSAYDTLRKLAPDFVKKIVAVEGDVSEIRLGINDEDWKTLTEEVNVIFHAAATTRFDEPIRVATLINIRGTREILKLGKACKNLRSFVHISTAYTHATTELSGQTVYETFYNVPVSHQTMITNAEEMDDETLQNFTANYMNGWPNTYTFTKAISEEMIRMTTDGMPICITRPGVVIASESEPAPGWLHTSAIFSASGVIAGVGLGVIHTLPVDVGVNLGFIPCDYVINGSIVAGKETAVKQMKGGNNTMIYTMTSRYRNQIATNTVLRTAQKSNVYTQRAIYYNYIIESPNNIAFLALILTLHVIPAYIADLVCLLIGKERRFVKIAKKVYNLFSALSYFWQNDWIFVDDNTTALYEGLSKQDKIIFNFDVTCVKWPEYITIWCLGIRRYLVKDTAKDMTYAMKKQKIFRIIHYVITPLYLFALWKLMCLAFTAVFGLITWIFY